MQIHIFEKAKMQLFRMSYYDLIKGYKEMFLLKEDSNQKEEFIEGTTYGKSTCTIETRQLN